MSNTGSTELSSKGVATLIISLKTPTQVARSLEISTTLDRSASVTLSMSFAEGWWCCWWCWVLLCVIRRKAKSAKFGRGLGKFQNPRKFPPTWKLEGLASMFQNLKNRKFATQLHNEKTMLNNNL